ncbi:Plasma membrane sulfite pump involved in sulfite metabolism [Basidiobolus ranarum]|uniref:Plasma membrane sulfite pump involved in sulfite metabolism n=1 Tax=Basidiobolus ranarum TaxID=34480 RepID=A0ABR2VJ98_9FUNG
MVVRREALSYNMGWWGLTFPLGVFTAGTLNIAIATDSRFFHGLTSFFVCWLVLNWFTVAIHTLRGVYSGAVFNAPCLQQLPCQTKVSDPEMQACKD